MQFSKIMLVSAGLALVAAQYGYGFIEPEMNVVTIQSGPTVVVTETDILPAPMTNGEQLSSRISKTSVIVQTFTNTKVDVTEVALLPSVASTSTIYPLGTSTTMTTHNYITTTASARIANEAAAATAQPKYGYSTINFPTITGVPSEAAAGPMKTILPGMAAIVGGVAALLV